MKYINKTLVNDQGYDVPMWVAVEGSFNVLTGKARLKMVGWKDVAAYKDKKPSAHGAWVEMDLASFTTFEAIWTEVAGKLIGPGSPFEGGTIEDTDPVA